MAHENFARLSETLTVNLDKIITIEWSRDNQDGFVHAIVTFDRGNRSEYTSEAAENLRRILGHTFTNEKRSNGISLEAVK